MFNEWCMTLNRVSTRNPRHRPVELHAKMHPWLTRLSHAVGLQGSKVLKSYYKSNKWDEHNSELPSMYASIQSLFWSYYLTQGSPVITSSLYSANYKLEDKYLMMLIAPAIMIVVFIRRNSNICRKFRAIDRSLRSCLWISIGTEEACQEILVVDDRAGDMMAGIYSEYKEYRSDMGSIYNDIRNEHERQQQLI